MIGFLPAWMAFCGLILCSVRAGLSMVLPGPLPWWLLPTAATLAAGTAQ